MAPSSEEAYLDKAIARYSPQVAATARAGLRKGDGQVVLKSKVST